MLKDSQLIPLTNTHAPPLLFFAHTLRWGGYANFPRPWMTIRSLSLHGHERPCNYSTSCSTPEALDDCHLTQSHTGTAQCPNREGEASALTPLTSCTHAGRLCRQDLYAGLLDDLRDKRGRKNTVTRQFNYIIQFCVSLCVWVSVCVSVHVVCTCHTESMIPLRAWKPPHTGNTCSIVSAIVAS